MRQHPEPYHGGIRDILVHHDNDVIRGVVSTELRSRDEALAECLDRRPIVLDDRTPEEVVGYDENGLPA